MPAAKRRAAGQLQQTHQVNQRRVCRLLQLHRSVARYDSVCSRDDEALKARLKALAHRYPRYGYLLLHRLLRNEGLVVNRKRTYRVYVLGLQVRTQRRKKLQRPRVAMPLPTRVNERWSVDFVPNQLANGRRFRILNLVDDFSRQCVRQIVDTSISGTRLARYPDQLGERQPLPKILVCDNGTELTSKAMFFWSARSGTTLHFIQPGKPTQNAFVESFNARLRDNCLNQHWFRNLHEARQLIEDWRRHYNQERPHSSLGYATPAEYAARAA